MKKIKIETKEVSVKEPKHPYPWNKESTTKLGEDTLSAIITVAKISAQSLPDNLALQAAALYDDFEDVVGQTVDQGFKFRYDGKVWKTVQPKTIIQSIYPPGIGIESLYAVINETNAGTISDPIPYTGNMELENGKYYSQGGVTYKCIRDTGQPVYHDLSALVGLYVQAV